MSTYYTFKSYQPVVHPSSFVHPNATLIGNVIIGSNVYIGPGAVLRGDWGQILIQEGSNVQENCVIHMFPGKQVLLEKGSHIGHGAIIHGAKVGFNTLVGMNAVLMDEVEIGPECIVGALSFVKSYTKIPERSVVVGNPAKVIKKVSDEMLEWKTEGTQWYQRLPHDCKKHMQACDPLTTPPDDLPIQSGDYKPW
jgi:phenylacetic acid degradation protein